MTDLFDVAVVGAGVTGLSAALAAERRGASVVVLEADSECGGAIRSKVADGFLIESGATSMAGSSETMSVLRDLSLLHEVVEPPPEAARRFIVRNGKLCALPSSPMGVLTTTALSFRGKARLFAEPWVPRATGNTDSESLADLVRRRCGAEVLDYVIDPMVSGVYAGDPEQLSSRFALRMLGELEQEHGSILRGFVRRSRQQRQLRNAARRSTNATGHHSSAPPRIMTFRNGLQQLPIAIEHALSEPVCYNARVTGARYEDRCWQIFSEGPDGARTFTARTLVVAVPAHRLRAMSWPDDVALGLGAVHKVVHAPIATVAMGFERNQVAHPLNGFGVLVPFRERRPILGVLFNSTMFAGRAPDNHVLITCFVGGARFAQQLSVKCAEDHAFPEVSRLLGITGRPVFTSTQHWTSGIPQFNLGCEMVGRALEKIERERPGLFISGSFRSGVAVGECVHSGLSLGQRAATFAQHNFSDDYRILAETGLQPL